MAQLLDKLSGIVRPLRAHHTFGRNADIVDTIITDIRVSRIHVAVEWDGLRWSVKDLSKNGSWLNGSRLPAGESVAMPAGSELCLGGRDGARYVLTDDSPPHSMLLGTAPGQADLRLIPYLFLPNNDAPELVLTYSQREASWMCEKLDQAGEQHALYHGDEISCTGQRWQVFLIDTANVTVPTVSAGRGLDEAEFIFNLSLDEENTSLKVNCGFETVDLAERSHHYLLLHLARQRAEGVRLGLDELSQGWQDTEQLSRDLGMDMSHINILIFRARKQLAQELEGQLQTEQLVERGKGRVRFGSSHFSIYKGETLVCQLPMSNASPGSAQ